MATPTSFKQQCPSCEAMVPIRDPKLIGRKIDCPKCKYRFIVEEPADEVEEAEQAAPAKKGKAGSTSVTTKKPAAKAAGPRRADDDQDMEEAKPKKKQGGSGMLVVGIALAAVAIIALAVGAVFLFSGDDSDDTKPSRSTPIANNPPPEEKKKDEPKSAPVDAGPKPRQDNITNLLPNDAQFVLNLPLEHLLANPRVNEAFLKTPGSFHEGAFQHVWGVSPGEIRRVVLAANSEKKTLFSVMRTSAQMKEKEIVQKLKLKAEAPINGLTYYLVKKPLDALSTVLLKGPFPREKVALHFMDPFTVVCADPEPMNQFLQAKGQPKQLSKKPDEEEKQGGGGGQGGPMGGPPGMPGGPPGMQGGPGPVGVSPGGPGGGPGGGSNRRPGGPGGGGFQPPQGMAPGMMPPGMAGDSNGATTDPNAAAPFSSSYMTVDPQIKAALDQAEKVDKTENQNVLLSAAATTSALSLDHVKSFMAWAKTQAEAEKAQVPQLPDAVLKVGLDNLKSELKAVAVAVIDFNETKLSGNFALAAKNAKLAQDWEKQTNDGISTILAATGLDFVPRGGGNANNMAGMSGMPGMPGMPGMGGMPNMPGGGPPGGMSGMRPPGGMSGMRPPGGMMPPGMSGSGSMRPPSGGSMRPPGGMMPPGMPGGMPGMQSQGDGEEKPEGKGKMGDYAVWSKDNVLALGVTGNINAGVHKEIGLALDKAGIVLRSEAAMSDRQSHIHELAAAMQAYLEEKGHFPQGAISRAPDAQRVLDWRPDQRLSWMTEILPYLGDGEFKGIMPGEKDRDKYAWYEGPYVKAGMTVVPHFLAPGKSGNMSIYVAYPNLPVNVPALWATTHFVGIAGVGLDAADYRADDAATAKLRGVFGYDRVTKKADIKDGLNQTIVLIQVPPEPKSPWIAGGGSTVRGVSEDLDCVQPFVCTEHEGKRGTFAIMADGKVRFIPATINPKTFQAMCTIAGGDKIANLEKVAPEVPPPEEQPQAELKTEPAAPPAASPPAKTEQPAPKKNLPPGWEEMTSAEGRYTVALPPGKRVEKTTDERQPSGVRLTGRRTLISAAGNTIAYAVGFSDAPGGKNTKELLYSEGMLGKTPGDRVIYDKKFTFDGYPAREFQIEGKNNTTTRMILVKDRLYQLMAAFPAGKADEKAIQTFFDSFKLTKK